MQRRARNIVPHPQAAVEGAGEEVASDWVREQSRDAACVAVQHLQRAAGEAGQSTSALQALLSAS